MSDPTHLSPQSHAQMSVPGHVHPDLPYSRPTSPSLHQHQLGFVGLGAMGYLMARNLAKSRHSHPLGSPPLLVYNRTKGKSEALLSELGPERVRVAESVEQLATECDIIITSLSNDETIKLVYQAFSQALQNVKHDRHKIFVETSTIYPTLAGELDDLISRFPHTHLLTCPVFGPPAAADKAQLILCMSGDYRSKKEVAHLLVPSVGRKVIDLGGNLEKAPTMKLIGNSLIMGAIEIMSESLTLGEKAGIDSELTLGLIKDIFPNTPLASYGHRIVNDQFDGRKGFAIDGGIKDARHIRRLTNRFNAPMPTVDRAHANMLTARAIHVNQVAQGTAKHEVLDWSAMIAGTRVAAGLDAFDSEKHMKVVKED